MEFIKGVDISMLKEMEELGARYFDNGVEKDIIEILKDYGINAIRLRLWHNPYDEDSKPYGGGTNDFATTVELAERIIEKKIKFVLDIHYSDFWTDPKKQLKPKAWEDFSERELEDAVYKYTYKVVSTLKSKNLFPSSIQVGNELTNGFLWPQGKLPNNYKGMIQLLKSGIRAIKDIDENIEIILHLDCGGDNKLYRDWFDVVIKEDISFDIIGLSYYPYWHGTLDELEFNMNDISKKYNKDVMVVETAYGFTTQNCGSSAMIFSEELADKVPFQASEKGQAKYMKELMKRIKNVNFGRGKGFFYWEPAWLPIKGSSWATEAGKRFIGDDSPGGNSWANQGLFDFKGNALLALKEIKNFK